MSAAAVNAALERIRQRHPTLGRHAQTAADWLTAGEGVEMLDQASVQEFLHYTLPRKLPQQEWDAVVAGAAELFDELGLDRYAAIARSSETRRILGTWRFNPDAAAKEFLKAQAASGVDPPDTETLTWGSVMGIEESNAREHVARALELAILAGELTPGGKGWKQAAARVCEGTLSSAPDGDVPLLERILSERTEM